MSYDRFSNSLTLQYGCSRALSYASVVQFPLTFTQAYAITASWINDTTTIGARTKNGFTVYCTNTTNIDWIAIGYI